MQISVSTVVLHAMLLMFPCILHVSMHLLDPVLLHNGTEYIAMNS